MKHSIKKQLIARYVFLIICTVGVSWFVNLFFLENYYSNSKLKKLVLMYDTINEFDYQQYLDSENVEDNSELTAFKEKIDTLCRRFNVSFIVTDDSSNTIFTSTYDSKLINHQLRNAIFSREEAESLDVLVEKDSYSVAIMVDPNDNMEYLSMWGNLDNGDFFLMRTAIEGIRDNVKITNTFMFFVSLGSIVFGVIAIYFVSIQISKPIFELTNLSKRMANLDFNAKYQGKSNNEIDVLGENFNQMSEALEDTIGRLKTANEELQADVQDKIKIDNMRKEFLANVSHELKTPIALIQGYAEGLKEGINDDPESRDFYCDVIIDETAKMNKLVKQLITLNQVEFGAEELEMTRFSIAQMLQSFVQANEILAKEKDVKVEFQNSAGDIYIWADEYLVGEAFRNYYNNALNHVDNNKVIKVKLDKIDGKIRVAIYNSGSTIPESAMANLWEKFYKIDKARTREYGGSGIGLSIVRVVIEKLHGEYGVVNMEKGVEFWFTLPIE